MTIEPSPPRSQAPLFSLQCLRAVAALLVMLHHVAFDGDTIAARTGASSFDFDRFFDFAFGIHLFFVISGFIMLRTARGFGSVRGATIFLTRRILRVVPLYWLLTSLVLVGTAVAPGLLNTPPGGLAVVIGSYLFVPVMRSTGELRPVLGQGWTLNYEMFFYVLFACAMLLPRRLAVPALATTLVFLVALGRVVNPPFAAVAVWTDGLLLEFLFGIGIALLAERGATIGVVPALILTVSGCLGAVLLGPMTPRFDGLALWAREGLPAAFIVAGCVLGPAWRSGRAVLALALVGDASYSLYLSHPFAIRLLRSAWLNWTPAVMPPAVYLVTACAAAITLALLLHRWVERPMTEWLQRHNPTALADPGPILPEVASSDAARVR
ncbi:MAG: acyltransferase family protein [Janthinobacterium lividum]